MKFHCISSRMHIAEHATNWFGAQLWTTLLLMWLLGRDRCTPTSGMEWALLHPYAEPHRAKFLGSNSQPCAGSRSYSGAIFGRGVWEGSAKELEPHESPPKRPLNLKWSCGKNFVYVHISRWYAKRFLHPDIVAAYESILIWVRTLGWAF